MNGKRFFQVYGNLAGLCKLPAERLLPIVLPVEAAAIPSPATDVRLSSLARSSPAKLVCLGVQPLRLPTLGGPSWRGCFARCTRPAWQPNAGWRRRCLLDRRSLGRCFVVLQDQRRLAKNLCLHESRSYPIPRCSRTCRHIPTCHHILTADSRDRLYAHLHHRRHDTLRVLLPDADADSPCRSRNFHH